MSPGVEGLAYSNKWAGLNEQGQRTQDTEQRTQDSKGGRILHASMIEFWENTTEKEEAHNFINLMRKAAQKGPLAGLPEDPFELAAWFQLFSIALQQIEFSTKDWASNAVKITVLSHTHIAYSLKQKLNHCWDPYCRIVRITCHAPCSAPPGNVCLRRFLRLIEQNVRGEAKFNLRVEGSGSGLGNWE